MAGNRKTKNTAIITNKTTSTLLDEIMSIKLSQLIDKSKRRTYHKAMQKQLSGWAGTHFANSTTFEPQTVEEIQSIIREARQEGKKIIPRGAGRSYGDEALNTEGIVLNMIKMDRILEWDKDSGILTAESGTTIEQVLLHTLKDSWALGAIPGTRYVTLGGALANNVHGKNSFKNGNFGDWVKSFKITLASGEILICSKNENNNLFFSAIGGAGLLGVITEMTLQLSKIPSPYLAVKKITAPNLNDLMELLDEEVATNDFAIAQVDCFPQSQNLGRGTIHASSFVSSHIDKHKIIPKSNTSQLLIDSFQKVSMIAKYFLNNYTMSFISRLKYHLDKITSSEKTYTQDLIGFSFLLDGIPNWNQVFRNGFFEYEPLIPGGKAKQVIADLIRLTHKYGMPAYLAAIKIHKHDDFLLSYSMDGYSFGMNIPRIPSQEEKQNELFCKMNEIVIRAGGIVYLAKDATLTRDEFRQMYDVEKFLEIKRKYDPEEVFQSDMYRRLFK